MQESWGWVIIILTYLRTATKMQKIQNTRDATSPREVRDDASADGVGNGCRS